MWYKYFFIFFFLGISLNAQSQNATIQNLVFEGAGIRGLAYVGAYKKLVELNKLQQLQNVSGTSAGAIIALCIALEYTPKELEKIISELKLQSFNDGNFLIFGGLYRVNKKFGYYKGNKFLKWLEQIIETKTKNSEITFAEMQSRGYKNLYITGTSLNKQKAIIFSVNSFPNMKVKDAVRASMSIPLYYEPVILDSVGKKYKDICDCLHCDIVVDGGILENFPIHVFDTLNNYLGINMYKPNYNTIGLRIDSESQIQNDSADNDLAEVPIINFQNYINAFYTLGLESVNRGLLSNADWQRTISIGDAAIQPKVKRLNMAQKYNLMQSGSDAVLKYFAK
jgi:NTE family protein